MAKKNKVLKSLKKEVARLRKQNDKLAEAIEEAREDQASAYRELRSLLEERLPVQEAVSGGQEGRANGGDGIPEATEAARRRAEEVGVDISDVKGTGSRGRVLVTDVEAAANAR